MALVHHKDPARAERYLRAVVELSPTKQDYEQLLAIYGGYGDDPAHREGRMVVLSGLLGFGGPFMPRVIELGKSLAAQGDRRWAWCVLSPLMNSTLSEPQLKATVLELRKEFEKSDNTAVLTRETHLRVRPPGIPAELALIVAELDELASLGRTRPDEAGATGIGRLDERTAVGKNFAGVAARLGLEGTQLTRAQELPEPYTILDSDRGQPAAPAPGHVVVRAELLQLLSVAETAFLFSSLLEQSRPGIRLLASLKPEERMQLVPALYAACDLIPAPPSPVAQRLASAIREQVPEERRVAWATRLREAGQGQGVPEPEAEGVALYHGMLEVSRRVGLVGAADLRFAARVITRLDDTLPKMQTVGRIDDLDEFIAGAPPVRSLLGFAVSPLFGRLLHGED